MDTTPTADILRLLTLAAMAAVLLWGHVFVPGRLALTRSNLSRRRRGSRPQASVVVHPAFAPYTVPTSAAGPHLGLRDDDPNTPATPAAASTVRVHEAAEAAEAPAGGHFAWNPGPDHFTFNRSLKGCRLLGEDGGPSYPIGVALTYDSRDPLAVTMVISLSTQPDVTWTFARDLLADALVSGASGHGQARLKTTSEGRLLVTVMEARGKVATMEVPVTPVRDLIRRIALRPFPEDAVIEQAVDALIRSTRAA